MTKRDKNIIIFDTTLRDGEQSPGASMNTLEKIQIAQQLEKLNVDIIEAGFAAASPGDFDAISQIAQTIQNSSICSLARAIDSDIKLAGESIAKAKAKRIHTFIATSPIHMEFKLKMTPNEVIKRAVNAVKYAKTFVDDVEFSLEDAGRSELSFMKEITQAVIEAGAKTINLPDTVGYRLPNEITLMVKNMVDFIKSINSNAIVSLHNHNDLGLAVANTLAGIEAGARQVECTINGLGERAGNAAMEEIVMALKTRKDIFNGIDTNINTKEIYQTSRMIARITGIEPQPNKAIVGKNAFSHESGIHQDGMLKNTQTYEIMKPEDIGIEKNDTLVLGKHSGRAAFKDKLLHLGFGDISDDTLNLSFKKFKILSDKKKNIVDEDIRGIFLDSINYMPEIYKLISYEIDSNSTQNIYKAIVHIESNDGKTITQESSGNGTLEAIFSAIDKATNIKGELQDYSVKSLTKGQDSLANAMVKVLFNKNTPAIITQGIDINTLLASAKAYMNALNRYLSTL